jgi:hypothetical protein
MDFLVQENVNILELKRFVYLQEERLRRYSRGARMDCTRCPHQNDLEACHTCPNKKKRRRRTVEVQLKTHTKVKVGDVPVGKTFRPINLMKAYQVIDLTKGLVDILDLKKAQEAGAVLVGGDGAALVFAADLTTGVVEHFAKETEVYLCPMKSFEKDEE